MIFLNPLPNFLWFLLLIPIAIFLINRKKYKIIKFSSISFLEDLNYRHINRIKILNILLLIIRTLIILLILFIIMKPQKKSDASLASLSNNKTVNIILIDDSFSSIYGNINGIERITIINDIINSICSSYPIESKLILFSSNRGLIFNDFNTHNFNENILINAYNDFDLKEILNSDYKDYNKNIHIVSNFKKSSYNEINEFCTILKAKDNYEVFFHNLPDILNNQYIKTVKLINDFNNTSSSYEIHIGNNSDYDVNLVLSVDKNIYNYNSKSHFYIDNTIPIYNNKLLIPANSYILDTMKIDLDLNESFELFFALELESGNDVIDWVDDRIEDNSYSYSFNVPNNINLSVFYNDYNSKNKILSILESFRINTNKIDSSLYNIDYFLVDELHKYYDINSKYNILLFLGYDIFEKSDYNIISDFLDEPKNHILIFPTQNNINKKKFKFKLNNYLSIDNIYKNNPSDSYNTIVFDNSFKINNRIKIDNNFKISSYFFNTIDTYSILNINEEESIWSRYNIGNSIVDIFGFFIDYGNNFFSDEFTYSIPLVYQIIIGDKIKSQSNNLVMNKKNELLKQDDYKKKFVNLKNDSIVFFNSNNQIVYSKDLLGLIDDNQLLGLYSFTPDTNNFDLEKKFNFNFDYKIIDYNDSNADNLFLDTLEKSDIIKYFVYFLFALLMIETFLSNAKPPKRI